jgi:hypothetical protein
VGKRRKRKKANTEMKLWLEIDILKVARGTKNRWKVEVDQRPEDIAGLSTRDYKHYPEK